MINSSVDSLDANIERRQQDDVLQMRQAASS